MKKIELSTILIAIFIFFILSINTAFAAIPATSSGNINTEVEQIKDKIASKVAEISSNTLFVFRGKVEKLNSDNKSFYLTDGEKEYSVSFLSDTSYFWLKNDNKGRLSLNFSNVENDDDLVVFGGLIKINNQINAKKIFGKIFPKIYIGEVVSITKEKLIVKTLSSNTERTIDISGLQNSSLLDKNGYESFEDPLTIKEKSLIYVYGYLKSKTAPAITALKISVIQN
jgi:hypothetical protein